MSRRITEWLGAALASPVCVLLMVIWALWAWTLHFSDSSQLVFSTITSAVTTWMVFLILHVQNKDSRAMNLKLDEIIRSQGEADNRFCRLETASDEVLEELAEDDCG